jgi:hypothetical protein
MKTWKNESSRLSVSSVLSIGREKGDALVVGRKVGQGIGSVGIPLMAVMGKRGAFSDGVPYEADEKVLQEKDLGENDFGEKVLGEDHFGEKDLGEDILGDELGENDWGEYACCEYGFDMLICSRPACLEKNV